MSFTPLLRKFKVFTTQHPMLKGMMSYALLWPIGAAIQQIIEDKTLSTFDYKRCIRFSVHGAFVVGPIIYGWVRLTSAMWSGTNLKIGLIKAILDQACHGPLMVSLFYINMNLLEFKSLHDGIKELKLKFWPTWRVSVWVWPIIHTVNFSLVPERNRVIYVCIVSVLWSIFLAYMKQLQSKKQLKLEEEKLDRSEKDK